MIDSGSQQLLDAYVQRTRLSELPPGARPTTLDEAYECQASLIERLTSHYGGHVIGYKIACTNAIAQRLLKVSEPFYGRLLSTSTFDSPATLPASRFVMRVIESEFAFRFARDLPPAVRPPIAIKSPTRWPAFCPASKSSIAASIVGPPWALLH